MDVGVAHIFGAFREAIRNRQRERREVDFRTACESNAQNSLYGTDLPNIRFQVPLRVVYQVKDYMQRLTVREAIGSTSLSTSTRYDALLRDMKEKASMLDIKNGRWTIIAVPSKDKHGQHVRVNRENCASVIWT